MGLRAPLTSIGQFSFKKNLRPAPSSATFQDGDESQFGRMKDDSDNSKNDRAWNRGNDSAAGQHSVCSELAGR